MKKFLFLLLFALPVFASAQIVRVNSMQSPTSPVPSITTSVSVISTPFITNSGTPSSGQSFTTSASLLTIGGTVHCGAGYEASINGGSTYTAADQTLPITSGNFTGAPVTVLVRLAAADAPGTYNSVITISSSPASARTVNVSGTVNSTSPFLSVNGTPTPMNTTAGTASTVQSVAVSGGNLTNSCLVTFPSPIVGSLDNVTFGTTQTIGLTSGNLTGQPVTVFFKVPSSASAGSGSNVNMTFASSPASTVNVPLTWTISGGGTTNDTIDVNVWDSINNVGKYTSAAPAFWNNWGANDLNNIASDVWKYRSGVQTNVRFQIDAFNFVQDQGAGYNSGTTTGYPVLPFEIALVSNTSTNTFTITGLPAATNGYKIRVMCSRQTATSRPITGTIHGTSITATVDAKLNDTFLDLDNISGAGGTLQIDFTNTGSFLFINFIEIIKKN